MTDSNRAQSELDRTSNIYELGVVIRRLAARGYSDRQIARTLGIAPETVRTGRASVRSAFRAGPA